MIAMGLSGILTKATMVSLVLMFFGLGLAGLGMWGRKKNGQGTRIYGRYLALGVREVNYREVFPGYKQPDERRANVNEDILKGKWNEIKGGVKEKWGKLTDDDLTVVEGNKDKLLGILQQRYGYAKDKAEREYKDFIGRYKG